MEKNKGAFGKPGALRPQKTVVRRQYFTFGGSPADAIAQLNQVLLSIEDKLSVKITEYYTSNINELGHVQEALRFVLSLPLNLPVREESAVIEDAPKGGKVIPLSTPPSTASKPELEQSENENGEPERDEESPEPSQPSA